MSKNIIISCPYCRRVHSIDKEKFDIDNEHIFLCPNKIRLLKLILTDTEIEIKETPIGLIAITILSPFLILMCLKPSLFIFILKVAYVILDIAKFISGIISSVSGIISSIKISFRKY